MMTSSGIKDLLKKIPFPPITTSPFPFLPPWRLVSKPCLYLLRRQPQLIPHRIHQRHPRMRESSSSKQKFIQANRPYVYMSSGLIQMAVLAKNSPCVLTHMQTPCLITLFSIFDFRQHIFHTSCAFLSRQAPPLQRMAFSKQISPLTVDLLDEKNTQRESADSFILYPSRPFD